jgi:rubrerythrin
MTENEAIREARFNMSTIGLSDKAAKRVVKARNMAIKALEKQIPKKPTYEGDGYAPDGTLVYDTWICPCCDKRYEVDYDDYDYCPNCGQKLDLDRDEQPTAFSMRAKPIDNFVNPFETKAGGING